MDLVDILEALWRLIASGYRRPVTAVKRIAVLGLVGAVLVGAMHLWRGDVVDGPLLAAYALAGLFALVAAVLLVGVLIKLIVAGIRFVLGATGSSARLP